MIVIVMMIKIYDVSISVRVDDTYANYMNTDPIIINKTEANGIGTNDSFFIS